MEIVIAGMTRSEIDDEWTKKEITKFLESKDFEISGKPNKDGLVTLLYQFFEVDEDDNMIVDEPEDDESEDETEDSDTDESEEEDDEEDDSEGTQSGEQGSVSKPEMVFLTEEEVAERIHSHRCHLLHEMKNCKE